MQTTLLTVTDVIFRSAMQQARHSMLRHAKRTLLFCAFCWSIGMSFSQQLEERMSVETRPFMYCVAIHMCLSKPLSYWLTNSTPTCKKRRRRLQLVRVFNWVSVWKKSNSVGTVASPTRPYRGCFNDRIFRSYPLLQHSSCVLPRGFTGRASTASLKLVRFGHYPEMR
jgi:hypothetical protein